MASASNRVIAGKFEGKYIKFGFADRYVLIKDISSRDTDLSLTPYKELQINKNNVQSYEVITEEKMKSGTSAILRGALGATILGPVGILAGLTAKTKGFHTIAIEWANDEKSLIEVDEKMYKQITKDLF